MVEGGGHRRSGIGTRRLWAFAQVATTLIVLGYMLWLVDLNRLREALARAPMWSVGAAVMAMLGVMALGALRWSWLIRAYGAHRPPPLARLFHLQLVGLLYNMLPGAVGGDVVRGIVTRTAFGERNTLTGVAVVLIERIVGLLGLVMLVSALLILRRSPELGRLVDPRILWLGLFMAVLAVATIAISRRLARFAPGRLGQLLAALPELTRPGALAIAVALSVCNQAMVGVVGHTLIAPLAPQVQWLDSLALSPIAFAAVFFPLTVAGAGSRDAAMVLLYGTLGVDQADALAASVQVLLTYAIVAGAGGLSLLAFPLSRYGDEVPASGDAPA